MPYPNLGEFVIVGVIAINRSRQIHWKLLPTNKTTRLTRFFPELKRGVFTNSLKSVRKELDALSVNINGNEKVDASLLLEENEGATLFQVLTSKRGGMIRIKARGAALSDCIADWVEDAFERYVMRTEETVEEAGERLFTGHVRSLLEQWNLNKLYTETQVGDEHYHAKFPFAYTPEGAQIPTRAIKPLFLGQDSPTRIFEHGDAWLQKIRRLRQFHHAPERVIFPVKLPTRDNDHRAETSFEECEEVANLLLGDFENEGIEVMRQEDQSLLRAAVLVDPVGEMFLENPGSLTMNPLSGYSLEDVEKEVENPLRIREE